jgi:serine/threonine protein kinase
MLLSFEFMHNRDMCHRDLKPDNIFIQDHLQVINILKIGDFGCAREDLLNGIKESLAY